MINYKKKGLVLNSSCNLEMVLSWKQLLMRLDPSQRSLGQISSLGHSTTALGLPTQRWATTVIYQMGIPREGLGVEGVCF